MPDFLHPVNDGRKEFILVNAFEGIVKDNVEKMVECMEVCTCEKCISDICAIVLNQLPPNYVTTRKGELLTRAPQGSNDKYVDLTVKVVHAIQLVKNSPRH